MTRNGKQSQNQNDGRTVDGRTVDQTQFSRKSFSGTQACFAAGIFEIAEQGIENWP